MSQHGCPERMSNRSKGFQEESGSQPTMEVLVETLTGTAFEMTVSPSDTIFAIKSKIFRVEGIPVGQQHLVYNLKELEDSCSLRELGIGDGARLRLVLGMRGGPVSTRRLPPPPVPAHSEPWPDIERLLDSNRDDLEWSGGSAGGSGSGSGSGSGCKVTVLVFRDGERVNMVRVKENHDGTYSPLDTNKYSATLTQLCEPGGGEVRAGASAAGAGAGALRENAVTMGKMLELRRRMESLTLQRAACDVATPCGKVEIQKTRSEEALPTRLRSEALLRDAPPPPYDEYFTLRDENNYTRYSYECGLGGYTLLPPIGAREERAPDGDPRHAHAHAHAPLARRQSRREGEEAAILEECLGSEECVRAASPRPAHGLQPVPQDYGELVGGCAWRGHSASALQLRAGACAAPRDLSADLDAPFSSSTSDLENLKRNSRLLPGLSRARPREHLHLSDEGLHLRREPPPREPPPPADQRLYLRRDHSTPYDSIDTQERLYLRRERGEGRGEGEAQERLYVRRDAAPEPGGEGRHARIQKIAERERRDLPDPPPAPTPQPLDAALDIKEKKIRLRCGWCKKRLSVASVHACRCGGAWCAAHRYAEVHGCAWDYKADPRARPPPPTLHPPKLPKI